MGIVRNALGGVLGCFRGLVRKLTLSYNSQRHRKFGLALEEQPGQDRDHRMNVGSQGGCMRIVVAAVMIALTLAAAAFAVPRPPRDPQSGQPFPGTLRN